jgi:adenylate cyclase
MTTSSKGSRKKMETPELERRLAAILAADVQGFSRLMEIDETATLETLSAFRLITDDLISQSEGRIANTAGDSILAEFPTVLNAVRCAVAIQQALAIENERLPELRRMYFRIGINLGDVMVKNSDIFGDGVNIAARLESLAEPGGICISRGVRDAVRAKLAYRFEDVGVQTVKNIARPIRAYHVRFNELAATTANKDDMVAAPADSGSNTGSESQPIELAFWDSIKDSRESDDFEAYLVQFPEGSFRALADKRLEILRSRARGDQPADGQDTDRASDVEMAFWDSIKDSESAADYMAYLEKFPDGAFIALARARLDSPSPAPPTRRSDDNREGMANSTALELAFWESMKDSENYKDFEEYLKQFPSGTFAGLAMTRLDDLLKRQ